MCSYEHMGSSADQLQFTEMIPNSTILADQWLAYPRFRYMGSKFRLVQWIHDSISHLNYESVIDGFSGSGGVSYFFKCDGKRVHSNDSLVFPSTLSKATVENNSVKLTASEIQSIASPRRLMNSEKFIQQTYRDIFYTEADLNFLDCAWAAIRELKSPLKRSLAISALLRSAIKRQPRGLFTVAGDPEKYKDGRRDLKLSLREHFLKQSQIYNDSVFSNGFKNKSTCGNVFDLKPDADLVYLDPPYVPRADDNCYVKRYHFLEGLACYWKDKEILYTSKVNKIAKPFTPFAYRRTAIDAFDQLFRHFAESIQVLSYSSNAYPDLTTLRAMMRRYKKNVEVVERSHQYHFGTHKAVKRNSVQEYLIIGTS